MGFEVFEKRAAGRSKAPTITIQKRGTISLNAAAAALLTKEGEEPDGLLLELLYDREHKVVGFRRATGEHPSTYALRKQPHSASYLLGGRAFTQYYGIDTSDSRRYVAKQFEDGVVGVALDDRFVNVARGERTKDKA